MKILGMMLVKNEANRWLHDCLLVFRKLCDEIIVLDDCSDDNTPDICKLYDCKVFHSEKSLWSENEVIQRKKLFDLTIKHANNNDWIICLDADELLIYEHIAYIKYIMNSLSNQINGIAFKLYDMWNNDYYRQDEFWRAHFYHWAMAIRYDKSLNYQWSNKKLHCGRFPLNSAPRTLPTMIPIKHMGWSTQEDRIKKYNRYMEVDPEGKEGILGQYKSILDKNPNLQKFYKEDRKQLHESIE